MDIKLNLKINNLKNLCEAIEHLTVIECIDLNLNDLIVSIENLNLLDLKNLALINSHTDSTYFQNIFVGKFFKKLDKEQKRKLVDIILKKYIDSINLIENKLNDLNINIYTDVFNLKNISKNIKFSYDVIQNIYGDDINLSEIYMNNYDMLYTLTMYFLCSSFRFEPAVDKLFLFNDYLKDKDNEKLTNQLLNKVKNKKLIYNLYTDLRLRSYYNRKGVVGVIKKIILPRIKNNLLDEYELTQYLMLWNEAISLSNNKNMFDEKELKELNPKTSSNINLTRFYLKENDL